MICRQYIDEVKLRLSRIGVVTKINDAEILTYVNRARRAVQMLTLPIYEQRFGAFVQIPIATITADTTSSAPVNYFGRATNIYRVPLGVPVIDIISAYISWTDTNNTIVRRETRRIAKKEMHSINYHSWNLPSIDRPVYALETKQAEATPGQFAGDTIYLGGLEDTLTTTILTQANPMFEMWYTAPLADFQAWNEVEPVLSPDLEELAIIQTMLYCLSNFQYIAQKQVVQADFELFKNIALSNYDMMKNKPIQVLPSEEGF